MNPSSAISQHSLFATPKLALTALLVDRETRLRRCVARASQWASKLQLADQSELQYHTQTLRGETESVLADDRKLGLAIAVVIEALSRTHNIRLFDTQIRAGLTMCQGAVAEMQTGEGKTFAGVLPTFVFALAGQGVHVCAPNAYLARRDQRILASTFELLGLTTAVRMENDSFQVTRRAYEADVTYGSGQLFGFDYLRDQWSRRQAIGAPLGTSTVQRLTGTGIESRIRIRGLYAAVVDEADQVLVDDATSPLLITTADSREAPDSELHHTARSTALGLDRNLDFVTDPVSASIQLTDSGFQRVYENETLATSDLLCRPWHDYVTAALKAEYLLRKDRHYVVVDDDLKLVEQSTGRIFNDRTWSDGLHQAVQTKERLKVTAETESQGRITRQVFFRLYANLCGMTGTALSCRQELQSIYQLNVHEIPTRLPTRRRVLATKVCDCQDTKIREVVHETVDVLNAGRSVLIGTNHIYQTNLVASALRDNGISPQVLNGIQDEQEAAVIANAGQPNVVTVATHLAGRGTDIQLNPTVADTGGLHVIALEHHRLERVDRQLIGRGARQGDRGTARFYISPDDSFVSNHAPYLAQLVAKCVSIPQQIELLCQSIRSAQHRLEADDRKIRFQLMKQNARPGDALSGDEKTHSKATRRSRRTQC